MLRGTRLWGCFRMSDKEKSEVAPSVFIYEKMKEFADWQLFLTFFAPKINSQFHH